MPASLHTHSWHSLLEGTASPAALLARARACGYTALALTDTNNLYGAAAFADTALGLGVRPLLGACLRQRRERCVALIANHAGYHNLCRVLSRLHLGTGAPVSLADLLNSHPEGLHVLADDAVLAGRLRDTFGPRLWLEVVRPPRSPKQERELLEAGRRLGLRPVASTAAHFATPDEYPAFRVATAVRQTTLLERVPHRLAITPDHHLVDEPELRRRFRDLPEAVRNAEALADRLSSDVLPRELILPAPRTRFGVDSVRRLRHLCERGLDRRPLHDAGRSRQRLHEELALIEAAGLPGYFLVVRGIARHARRKGHSMALRGSAGNSLVCYLLEITDVDPLRFGLSLERFLHAGRRDLPDIDLDFDWKVRDDVIDWVRRRHGLDRTAQIASHLSLQPSSAFRESAKVHGLSDEQVSQLLERVDDRVDGMLKGGELQVAKCPTAFPLEPERWPLILDDARRLLGRPHHLSIHPGGVVITPEAIEGYVPLQMAPKGVVITQFEKDAIERVGLVKIDLLGNRALATVDEAESLLKGDPSCPRSAWERTSRRSASSAAAPLRSPARVGATRSVAGQCSHAERGHEEHDPLSDEAAVALLRAGDTLGVNQLESPAVRHLLVQMRPDGLDDVIRALALVRPGAAGRGLKELYVRRKRGLEPVEAHPLIEPLLRETQGLMLYDDDALRVIRALTDLTVAEADRVRKDAAKEYPEDQERRLMENFAGACARRGIPRVVAEEQWRNLTRFRHYTFCKSHAVSYGLIAWRAASLKAHHPLAFWTAALNNNQGLYPRRVYAEAVKRAGLRLLLPCVNRSHGPFVPEAGAIRAGLGTIASLESELLETILAERDRGGPYRDLADFRHRVRPGPEALALLIGCGALDFTGRPRPALFLEADLQGRVRRTQAELFAAGPADWFPNDYDEARRLLDERRLLGFVVGPPLMSLFRPRLPRHLVTSRDLPRYVGRRVHVAGLTATARHALTAQGRPMQFVTLEDEWGLIEVTLFPGAGTVEERYGVLTLNACSFQRVTT
jgi:DNA-directed DNA polymerase III PolC